MSRGRAIDKNIVDTTGQMHEGLQKGEGSRRPSKSSGRG
jgi:hypothetical protein